MCKIQYYIVATHGNAQCTPVSLSELLSKVTAGNWVKHLPSLSAMSTNTVTGDTVQ